MGYVGGLGNAVNMVLLLSVFRQGSSFLCSVRSSYHRRPSVTSAFVHLLPQSSRPYSLALQLLEVVGGHEALFSSRILACPPYTSAMPCDTHNHLMSWRRS